MNVKSASTPELLMLARNGHSEPCTAANQCSYLFFCTLKGLEHPRMRKVMRQNGSLTYFTYHYLRY